MVVVAVVDDDGGPKKPLKASAKLDEDADSPLPPPLSLKRKIRQTDL